MLFRKVGKWLLTKSGKRFCFYSAGVACTGVALAHFLPHTILVSQYKKILHYYRKGMSVPVNKVLQNRFQTTLDFVGVAPSVQFLYEPFHVYGLDVMSAGASFSRFGVIVGLPITFQYESVDTAYDKPAISVNDRPISWGSEEGQKFLESLILSEKAQIYAMAREIKMRQTWKLGLDVSYAATTTAATYCVANEINTKFNLYSQPRSIRFFMYFLVSSFFAATYFMLKDITTVTLEKKIDRELIDVNPIFKEGGKEFYTKLIERNKILRQIMGTSGERMYTALGNENTFIRTKHLPIVQRKAFFEDTQESVNVF